MSIFDASKYEGLPPELATKIAEDVNGAAEAMRADFKAKMNAMDAKVKSANERMAAFEGIEPSAIADFKRAVNELGETKAAQAALLEEKKRLQKERDDWEMNAKKLSTRQKILQSLSEYQANGGLRPAPGADEDLIDTLEKKIAQNGDSVYFMRKDGTPFVTESGYGTAADFISQVLTKEKPYLFEQPRGDGAVGSKTPPGSAQIPRDQFNKLTPAEQMTAIKSGKAIVD